MNAITLIKQINQARRVHNELSGQIGLGIGSKKHIINAEGLYKQNEQQYYILLRCSHELDQFLGETSILTLKEQVYFETLLEYTTSLIKTIRFFPKITYFFWQRDLRRDQDKFYENALEKDWCKYQLLKNRAGNIFGRVKQFN